MIFASISASALGSDPTPYVDIPTGRRSARPASLLTSMYSPRPEYQVKQKHPTNRVLDALRPAVFARQIEGRFVSVGEIAEYVDRIDVSGATAEEREHAREVLSRLDVLDA